MYEEKVVITVSAVHAYRCSLKSREERVVASTVAGVEISRGVSGLTKNEKKKI